MKELNAAQMGTGAGAPCKLPRPVVFADGHGCARLRVECTVVPKNNTGGAVDYTGAKAKDAAACMFSMIRNRGDLSTKCMNFTRFA